MHMKNLRAVIAVLAVTVSGAEAGAEPAAPAPARQKAGLPAPEETFTLKPGEKKELPVKDLTRVAVGDPEVADIAVDGKGGAVLHITGGKPGETTLLVWTKDGARKAYKLVVQG
ncbi:pilus assembly protein N-terminal domain-containing protein [Archangium sp.]|uniref:pilus assembly protein N-terminal domain-containing protein n=1 Tax=Archangium sp. TaxID=1872627 RepID=UPI00389AE32A